MNLRRVWLSVMAACALFVTASAQEKLPIKFGRVSAEDFNIPMKNIDTGTSAVIIAEVGSSSFEGNSKGGFSLLFKKQVRIKILNKNGFDAATESIYLYSEGQDEEKLDNLKGSTFNIVDGKVVENKLESSAVFKDKVSPNLLRKKFTLPAVKEGSIIEYSYSILSDFTFNLQAWEFQGEYPRLWSEYQVAIPEYYNFVYLSQGYRNFDVNSSSSEFKSYSISIPGDNAMDHTDHVTISGNVATKRWVMKNVPAMKEESYTSTLSNHVSKIDFQLSQIRYPDRPVKEFMGNWVTVTEEYMKRDDFGSALDKVNNWLDDDIKKIEGPANSPLEKARKIYAFVRDNFTCTDHSAKFLDNSLKAVFKSRNGNVADINLLLVAMLRHENITADPVLLSTRSHGFAHEMYPLMNRFNYVVVRTVIDGKEYYLDASEPQLGFAKLPLECYNGVARVINNTPEPVYFLSDSLEERKVTSVFIVNNEKGQMEGSFQSLLGAAESMQIRETYKEAGKEAITKRIKAAYGSDMTVQDIGLDSLKELEAPIQLHYAFTLDNLNDDIVYFNPIMAEGFKQNLFKAAERQYPVEMPYTLNETFVFNMEIPKGYVVDELPKSAKVSFNENEGMFEYVIAKSETSIQLRSRVMLKKANFSPDEYNSLRDFFGYVVKKHSEQIVFKKKK